MTWVRFNIRPEELSVQEPSRAVVQQTLGGAWLDNYGPGIKTVNLSGNTGWRALYGEEDGFALFKRLNNTVFQQWHAKRAGAIAAGRDPDMVQLVLVDELDELVYLVAPMSFNLRRNKARPLLMQYQIALTVLADNVEVDSSVLFPVEQAKQNESSLDAIAEGGQQITPENPTPPQSVVDSLRDSVSRLKEMASDVDRMVDRSIGQPAMAFMEKTTAVLEITTETVGGIRGAIDTSTASLLATAGVLSQSGRNIGQTIAAVQNLPDYARARFMTIAGAYGNAFCVLRNAFKGAKYYPDYTGLYGSSYCSSTAGGTPLSAFRNENAFYRISPVAVSSPVTVTAEGQAAIASLSGMDVLTSTVDADLISRVSAAERGVILEDAA